MSARRFTEWQLYEMVEPFGERARYWQTGQICAAILNAQRTKRNDPIAKAEDFMPRTFRVEGDEDSDTDDFDRLKGEQDKALGRLS